MEAYMIVRWVVIFIVAAIAMEGVAWITHKYVMHGFLWAGHEDHHRPRGRLDENDLFTLFFSLAAATLIISGLLAKLPLLSAAGSGMTLYGIGYFLFHDIMFHRRIRRIKLKASTPYLRRIINAHAVHHQKTKGRTGGVSFGFLWAPKKYEL